MSEPIILWDVETGKQIIIVAPSEARRLVQAGVLTDQAPSVSSAPEVVDALETFRPERMPHPERRKTKG